MDATYIDLTIRLSLALLLGGAIGIEREYRAKEAGFRTHFLVALGSALFCVVSQFGFGVDLKDSSRVAAQVVSGIGFLGSVEARGNPGGLPRQRYHHPIDHSYLYTVVDARPGVRLRSYLLQGNLRWHGYEHLQCGCGCPYVPLLLISIGYEW